MKKIGLFLSCLLIILSFNSCSHDDQASPTVTAFPQTGLLGKPIVIQMQQIPVGNLQVFFDNEEAEISYGEGEISVVVPRTIQTATSTLKIIDLTSNETILDEIFSLKTPIINDLSSTEAGFNQLFTVFGENFDNIHDDIKVYVNNVQAQIVASDYYHIDIMLPTAITNSNLQIKVEAQRQQVLATQTVQLKTPIISAIVTTNAWITAQLVVDGQNFNPDPAFGQVWVNDVPCYFNVVDGKLSIDTPPGPFSDFQITNVKYKSAGQTVSFNATVPIINDAIAVDHSENNVGWNNVIFTHNNKAFNLISLGSPFEDNVTYVLMEFSPTTEKWTQLSTFQYIGTIADAVYDGNANLYIYKYLSASDSYVLTKLNMNTFAQENIPLPENKIRGPILFAYQSNFYIISGLDNVDGTLVTRTQKYKYSDGSNTWTTLPSSAFSEMPLVNPEGSGRCTYMHYNNNLYVNYGINFKTYKITPGLSVTEYPYTFCFGYQNAIIGRYGNGTSETLYNIATNANANVQENLFGYGNMFFTLNNQIYYIKNSWTEYYPNTYYTQKLRPSILNGIL